ncbi:hypothetical protein [Limisalsivibrio acetivorans]|uniref:hypothetical protein n=1 Tax=Limisalsivibrio acetivorans TaxID=1304888 RepID=UPI0003B6E221|nr:hypothetical protein [Limisalsivibrio acetivorans]
MGDGTAKATVNTAGKMMKIASSMNLAGIVKEIVIEVLFNGIQFLVNKDWEADPNKYEIRFSEQSLGELEETIKKLGLSMTQVLKDISDATEKQINEPYEYANKALRLGFSYDDIFSVTKYLSDYGDKNDIKNMKDLYLEFFKNIETFDYEKLKNAGINLDSMNVAEILEKQSGRLNPDQRQVIVNEILRQINQSLVNNSDNPDAKTLSRLDQSSGRNNNKLEIDRKLAGIHDVHVTSSVVTKKLDEVIKSYQETVTDGTGSKKLQTTDAETNVNDSQVILGEEDMPEVEPAYIIDIQSIVSKLNEILQAINNIEHTPYPPAPNGGGAPITTSDSDENGFFDIASEPGAGKKGSSDVEKILEGIESEKKVIRLTELYGERDGYDWQKAEIHREMRETARRSGGDPRVIEAAREIKDYKLADLEQRKEAEERQADPVFQATDGALTEMKDIGQKHLQSFFETGTLDTGAMISEMAKGLEIFAMQKVTHLLMEAAYNGVMFLVTGDSKHSKAASAALSGVPAILSILAGFKAGNMLSSGDSESGGGGAPVGQAHDGWEDVPDTGTYYLEKGETVLDKNTTKWVKEQKSGGINMHNNITINGGDEKSVMRALPALRQTIKDVVTEDIANNGQVRKSIKAYA